ncbi:MAG: protein-export chaperone SecB [Desulfobacterales bacterium]|nr:protein-export chaperone SecB [Desulfobacterales bacterium]
MTEQNTADTAPEAPVFRLQKMYVKDLSFENPNAPEVFLLEQPAPKVDMNLGLKHKKMDNDNWEIAMTINATITDTNADNKALFVLEIEHAGVFLLKNIPEEHLARVLNVDCPTLLFPFTRQIVTQLSTDGGFIPFQMEPINFLALYQNNLAQQQQQQQTQ